VAKPAFEVETSRLGPTAWAAILVLLSAGIVQLVSYVRARFYVPEISCAEDEDDEDEDMEAMRADRRARRKARRKPGRRVAERQQDDDDDDDDDDERF